MICFNMSLFIVGAFLLLTLLVGIYFSSKKNTFREHAVGNKQFATATLVATVLATTFGGGGLMRNVECLHALGLWWALNRFLGSFGLWIISRLALRMGPFMQHLSMAGTIGHTYGKYPRIIVALIGISGSIVVITMQINVMTEAISMCVNFTSPIIISILATLLLTFYSSFGGIRAVIFTDVLQFLTFSFTIPLLTWFVFVKIGKPIPSIIHILQSHTKFQFSSLFDSKTQLVSFLLFLCSVLVSYMDPQMIQRVYMASSPIQAQKVYSYATLFNIVIISFIVLVSIFVFVDVPDLPKEAVWGYLIANIPPYFKGLLSISLLAMAMSTADSCLNACSIMVSYDFLESIHKEGEIADVRQLTIARRTTIIVGLLAMLLAFKCKDLLELMFWSFACKIPVPVAPFILAVFGFRGTSRTALIGMATGALTILAWNKWVRPSTGIDGSFLAMLANGLAMMAAHYLLKQPEDAGWTGPDHQFKQIQQTRTRKRLERKEAIKDAWTNRKATLAKLAPSDPILRLTGLYLITTAILSYWFIRPDQIYWAICQGLVGAFFTSSKTFFSRVSKDWCMGLCWLIGLGLYLPLNMLRHSWHLADPIFTVSFFLIHCTVILSMLPLYLGIRVVGITLLVAIYRVATTWPFPLLFSLLPLFIAILFVCAMAIWFKRKIGAYRTKMLYLKDQEGIRSAQQLKASLYEVAIVPFNGASKAQGYGAVLTQVVRKIEESISFLDSNAPLYKADFQSIINKFYDWVTYFDRSEKAKKHVLLQPTKITLDKLMRKVELALSQEVTDPPRLLIETISDANGGPCLDIVCDIHQIVYLLVQAVLRVGKQKACSPPIVSIQLHNTALQFKQADSIDNSPPLFMLFQATALVIREATTSVSAKVKACYDDGIDVMGPQEKALSSIDLQQETMATITSAHYGYYCEMLGDEKQPTILLVFPNDITDILSKMTSKLPIDCLTSNTPVTHKEEADSMMTLMQFHDHVAQFSHDIDPVDIGTISRLLLLLRQHFGFKRHSSGQLFYVRAVGIAELVVEWAFHSPKVIYASLLYELVRHTCLPLSYVKEHYNLGVYAFVLNVVGIDKRQELDHPSLLYVQNRLKQAIKQDHVQLSVLFIKLAERLYDLRHAAGYIHLPEVVHMAQETLAIDVQIANTYLGQEIGSALAQAAQQALAICKGKDENENIGKDSKSL